MYTVQTSDNIDSQKVIEQKEERIIDTFTLQDLKIQIENIDSQIARVQDATLKEITGLEEEKKEIEEKIIALKKQFKFKSIDI